MRRIASEILLLLAVWLEQAAIAIGGEYAAREYLRAHRHPGAVHDRSSP